MDSDKGCNFALAFGNGGSGAALKGETLQETKKFKKKFEKIWWFQKLFVTLQSKTERHSEAQLKENIERFAIDEVVQETRAFRHGGTDIGSRQSETQ